MGIGYAGGMEGAGRRSGIGPTQEHKSDEEKKTESDLRHNVTEVIKEGFEYVLKGGGLWGSMGSKQTLWWRS